MKSFIFILIVAFLVVSCKQQNSNGTMTESEWKETIPQGAIMIDVMFNPTLELSEKIKETSLEELIIHRFDSIMYNAIKNRTNIDELYPISNPIDGTANVVELKAISSTSNLAKIYFLQDFYSFYKHNSSYYQNIIDSMQNKREETRKKEIQENWNRYK